MRKLAWIFAVLMGFSLPALAQRGQRGQQGHGGHEQRGNGGGERNRVAREPREHRDHVREHRDEYRERGHHRDRDRDVRGHFDGRRFDHDYFRERWGADHRFYWHHCRWYGPRFYVGSRFYYSGVWFVIVDPVPDYWGDGDVYIDDIDGVYYLVNPLYPQRIIVNVYIP
jgi:hypothetical protein